MNYSSTKVHTGKVHTHTLWGGIQSVHLVILNHHHHHTTTCDAIFFIHFLVSLGRTKKIA